MGEECVCVGGGGGDVGIPWCCCYCSVIWHLHGWREMWQRLGGWKQDHPSLLHPCLQCTQLQITFLWCLTLQTLPVDLIWCHWWPFRETSFNVFKTFTYAYIITHTHTHTPALSSGKVHWKPWKHTHCLNIANAVNNYWLVCLLACLLLLSSKLVNKNMSNENVLQSQQNCLCRSHTFPGHHAPTQHSPRKAYARDKQRPIHSKAMKTALWVRSKQVSQQQV